MRALRKITHGSPVIIEFIFEQIWQNGTVERGPQGHGEHAYHEGRRERDEGRDRGRRENRALGLRLAAARPLSRVPTGTRTERLRVLGRRARPLRLLQGARLSARSHDR